MSTFNKCHNFFLQKKVVSGVTSKPKQDDVGRVAARNRLAAIKNAMRQRIKQDEHAEAVASVVPKEVDKIVFDAGFFRVESPVKSSTGDFCLDHLIISWLDGRLYRK